jgi:hypothetical protein
VRCFGRLRELGATDQVGERPLVRGKVLDDGAYSKGNQG